MLDTDTLLMKRALELARRGAGLASPNPLVGAVLVNDDRVVGEGFHLYKQVKHAETYAIEAAGAQARGATLYCNLEPCCHQGRTPPCTRALIEAKIARAVIAVKDANTNVNGQGIDQLREAGVDVEVGLLEQDAIRVNESYFKFVTSRVPFVHGIIIFPDEQASDRWEPSSVLVNAACDCDAIIFGGRLDLSRLLMRESLKRERHRPLVIVADAEGLKDAEKNLKRKDRERVAFVEVASQSEFDAYSRKVAIFPSPSAVPAIVPTDLESTLAALGRGQITSVFNLQGVFDTADPNNFALVDKITTVVAEPIGEDPEMTIGGLEFELEDVNVIESGGFTELTGYPTMRGAA
jgi:diaminohydroxyphosphoribosylaminopyrimidine deaminase/5-amino-6-(5-phosphoribosylamino)uracil reductase